MEIKERIEGIYKLIKEEAKKEGTNITVNREKTLGSLKNIQTEITKKYKEAEKLWAKSVKLYEEFIKKAPGSQQMTPPKAKPTLPTSVDTVNGYVDMFKSISDKEITLPTSFVERIDSIRGISDMRITRDKMAVSVSGLTSAYYVKT